MSESPRPFRPRAEVPGTGDIEPVRAQLARVRVRSNAFALQNAIYLASATALFLLAGLAALAIELSRGPYALAVWSSLAILLLSIALIVRRARRRWIRRREAAVDVDRRAELEERLATLAGTDRRDSRLWGVLVGQNLRLLPRWAPAAMVPRVVPRTVWLLLLAVLTSFLVLRSTELPAAGGPGSGARPSQDGIPSGVDAEPGEAETASQPGSLSDLLSSLPERLRRAILGGPSGGKPRPSSEDPSAMAMERRGEVPDGARSRPSTGEERGDTMREMAPPPGVGEGAEPQTGREGNTKGRSGRLRPDSPESQTVQGEAPKPLPRVESGRSRLTAGKKPEGRAGSGGGTGAGAGGDGESLYGPRDRSTRAAGSFDLDLEGKRIHAAGGRGEDASGSRRATELASDQRLDDAIRRAQVPAEYEQIVQRLFSRPGLGARGAEDDPGAR